MAYEANVRVHPCPECGEPTEVSERGGDAACRAGHAWRAAPRSTAPYGAHRDVPEPERLALLAADKDVPHLVERDALALAGASVISAADSLAYWLRVYRSHDGTRAGDARVTHATFASLNSIAYANRQRTARACCEAAMDIVSDPLLRGDLRCVLARGAARERDIASAEAWLAPCDPRPVTLREDSSYRQAAGLLALIKGDAARTLALVGRRDGDIPLGDRQRTSMTLVRAFALEELGFVDEAIAMLRAEMVRLDPGGAVAICDVAPIWHPMEPCPRSLPVAAAEHFCAAARPLRVAGFPPTVDFIAGMGMFSTTLALGGLALATGVWQPLLVTPLFVGGGAWLIARGKKRPDPQARAKAIRRDGAPALGQIVRIQSTGSIVYGYQRIVNVELVVRQEGAPPRRVWTQCLVHKRDGSNIVRVFAWIPLRVDRNTGEIAVDAGI